MKWRHACTLLVIVSVLGCSKEMSYETSHPIGTGGDTAKFQAVINGIQWTALDSLSGAAVLSGFISIAGTSSDNKSISITLTGNSTGTYTLDQNSLGVLTYIDNNSANIQPFSTNQGTDTSQAGGQVIITAINTTHKTISGTFQCKVFRQQDNQQLIITQGVFNNIPYVTTLPPAPAGDTFRVTIGGTPWVAPSINGSTVMIGGSLSIEIAGLSTDGSTSVGLLMPASITPGTYSTDVTKGTYVGTYIPTPGVTLLSDPTGTITILSNDTVNKKIRGTFQFPAVDLSGTSPTVVLTQGYFYVSY